MNAQQRAEFERLLEVFADEAVHTYIFPDRDDNGPDEWPEVEAAAAAFAGARAALVAFVEKLEASP